MKLPRDIGPVHFVGIGGIGMSGIAEVLVNLGYTVQGSDVAENANVLRLREKGVKVAIGHKADNLDDAAVVVVSSAIKRDNPFITDENLILPGQILTLRERTPPTTPCFSFGAEPKATLLFGAWYNPVPSPKIVSGTTTAIRGALKLSPASNASDPVINAIPAAVSPRAPQWSESVPKSGPATISTTANGSMSNPAWTILRPNPSWMKSGIR